MRVRILQIRLPGTIGGLPEGEDFEPGRDYEVEDTVAETMKRNGWAVDAGSRASPSLSGRSEDAS